MRRKLSFPDPDRSQHAPPQGAMMYSADFSVMQYCNGVERTAMGPVGGTPPANGFRLIAAFRELRPLAA